MKVINYHPEGTTLFYFEDMQIVECRVKDIRFLPAEEGAYTASYQVKSIEDKRMSSTPNWKNERLLFLSKEDLKEELLKLF